MALILVACAHLVLAALGQTFVTIDSDTKITIHNVLYRSTLGNVEITTSTAEALHIGDKSGKLAGVSPESQSVRLQPAKGDAFTQSPLDLEQAIYDEDVAVNLGKHDLQPTTGYLIGGHGFEAKETRKNKGDWHTVTKHEWKHASTVHFFTPEFTPLDNEFAVHLTGLFDHGEFAALDTVQQILQDTSKPTADDKEHALAALLKFWPKGYMDSHGLSIKVNAAGIGGEVVRKGDQIRDMYAHHASEFGLASGVFALDRFRGYWKVRRVGRLDETAKSSGRLQLTPLEEIVGLLETKYRPGNVYFLACRTAIALQFNTMGFVTRTAKYEKATGKRRKLEKCESPTDTEVKQMFRKRKKMTAKELKKARKYELVCSKKAITSMREEAEEAVKEYKVFLQKVKTEHPKAEEMVAAADKDLKKIKEDKLVDMRWHTHPEFTLYNCPMHKVLARCARQDAQGYLTEFKETYKAVLNPDEGKTARMEYQDLLVDYEALLEAQQQRISKRVQKDRKNVERVREAPYRLRTYQNHEYDD